MKKICFVFFALLPLLLYGQAPWKEFYEGETDSKGRPEGYGVMGFGNPNHYVRFKGYFHKGVPGDGKHEGELWFYKDGKPYSHELGYFKGKKNKEYKFYLSALDGPHEYRFYKDDLWEKGIIKKGLIDGYMFKGNDNAIYKGTYQNGNYINGLLVDINTRKHQIFTNGTGSGWRDGLTNEGEQLYNEHYPRYMFHKLNNYYVLYDDINSNKGGGYVYGLCDKEYMDYESDIIWSGKIVDGKISGPGTGLVKVGDTYIYFHADNYVNGFPLGNVIYKSIDRKYKVEIGPLNNGIAYFKVDNVYGFIDEDGKMISRPHYTEILRPFENGLAYVKDKEKGEIIIDQKGKFLDYTENQKKINAENARIEEEKRLAAQQEEERRRIAAEQDFQNKMNSQGKNIVWSETITYDTASATVLGLLASATGITRETYTIQYVGVVESVVGNNSVKCTIKDAIVRDSKGILQRANGKAQERAQQAIGQTRVLDFSQFTLQ